VRPNPVDLKKKSYRRYNPEFKREAIKRASEEGVIDAAQKKSD
jgi:transposase-like protein